MRQWRWVIVFLAVVAVMASPLSARSDHHAVSVWGEPALPPDFTHFPYANPDAVKGGVIRLFGYGTFDTLNPYSLTGIAPLGAEFLYDTLLEPSADELATAYGLLAERVVTNGNQVTFFLRDQARFHDGTRVRAQDVVQSFITLREHGHPRFRNRYRSVTKAEAIAPNQVRFTLAGDDMRELPFLLGQIPVMAQRDLIGRDFDQVDLQPILGSGPYRVGTMKAGRVIEYVRLEDYWARDLPVRLGLYNFDRVIYDYYRDFTVAREAFKTGELDLWVEYTARFWASAFDLPEIADGQMLKHAFPHGRVARYQAMFFNLRNPLFQDPRVREAISLAWDFEWINKTVMFSAYTRLRSIFDNSKLAAADLPDSDELELLEPFRDQLPAELFAKPFTPPVSDGSGHNRQHLRKAALLLREAGWNIQDGRLVHSETGQVFKFDFLMLTDRLSPILQPLARSLRKLGIEMNLRVVDDAAYQRRIESFDFDMMMIVTANSHTPGRELLHYWSSEAADRKGSGNYAGVKSPVIDAVLDRLLRARDYTELTIAARALDRVVMNGFYAIPTYHLPFDRYVWWDRFNQPEMVPREGVQFESWWINGR